MTPVNPMFKGLALTFVCLRWFFTFYHSTSQLNYHLGKMIYFFQRTSQSKSRVCSLGMLCSIEFLLELFSWMPTIFLVHSGPRQPIPLNKLAGLLGDLVVSFIVGPLAYAYWTQWIGTIHFGTGASVANLCEVFRGVQTWRIIPSGAASGSRPMVSDLWFF